MVSNAADAVENIRFQSLTNSEALKALPDLAIMIKSNPIEKTISIRDTGVGMTKDELIKNLGTIAKSGTSELLAKLSNGNTSAPSDLIGQFGVGFYSAFLGKVKLFSIWLYLVADRVTVISKHNDDDQYVWESDSTSFKIAKDPRGNTLGRGTEVIIHVKDEAKEYLQNDTLQQILKKYSQFVTCPIRLWKSRTESVEEEVEEETKSDASDDVSVILFL